MADDPKKIRVSASYTLAEVIHFNRVLDCLEHGFAPGDQKRLMSSPLATSVAAKFRRMRKSGMEALAGAPRRRAKMQFAYELTDKARAELAEAGDAK